MTHCTFSTPADPTRTSTHALPCTARPQYNLPSSNTPKAMKKVPDVPLPPILPAFTVLPAHADSINPRAPIQAERHLTAKSVGQNNKNLVRKDDPQGNPWGFPDAPEEQVLNAAGIICDVATEQHPIPPTIYIRPASVSADDKSDAGSRLARECPVTACWYHENGFSSKAQRDTHAMTHYEGEHKCNECNILNGMDGKFVSAEYFKIHVRRHHMTSGVPCQICFQFLPGSEFPKHLDECMVHAVELESSGRARGCSLFSCGHHLVEFASKQLREQHMMRHGRASLFQFIT